MFSSFLVGTTKNKNIDHRGEEARAMFGLPTQNKNCAINASLPFLFDFFELKEKHQIRRYMRNICVIREISIIVLVRPVPQKNKLPSPNFALNSILRQL